MPFGQRPGDKRQIANRPARTSRFDLYTVLVVVYTAMAQSKRELPPRSARDAAKAKIIKNSLRLASEADVRDLPDTEPFIISIFMFKVFLDISHVDLHLSSFQYAGRCFQDYNFDKSGKCSCWSNSIWILR